VPYCTQCGNKVSDRDAYCAHCGARQAGVSDEPRPADGDLLGKMPARTAALLCYIPVVGWIPAIFVLASLRFRQDKDTRFHAFQGLYLFVAWLLVDWVLKPMVQISGFPLVGLFKGVLFAAWIWMMVKVSQNEMCKLPVVGELAEKSVTEQR